MSITKNKRIIVIFTVGALLTWAVILPAINNQSSNEKLTDIAALNSDAKAGTSSNSSQPENSTVSPGSDIKKLLSGILRGLNRQSSQGDVLIVEVDGKKYVRLESNFSVSDGPDLLVGLGNDNSVQELIGDLKANSGGQNYLIPDDIDINKYSQVFIHCRAFKYSFAVADLKPI